MPGACVLHASIPVFPCHVQPLQGDHVIDHRKGTDACSTHASGMRPGILTFGTEIDSVFSRAQVRQSLLVLGGGQALTRGSE